MNILQRLKAASQIISKGDINPSTWKGSLWQLFQLDGGFIPIDLANNSNRQINEGYMRNVDVYSIISKIVNVSKSIPWVVEKQLASGEWKELKNTPIHELMANPNDTKGYTWDDIEELTLIYLLVTGNTYVKATKSIGFDTYSEIDILPSNGVYITSVLNDFFMPRYQYNFSFGSTTKTYTNEDLKHIKFYNPSLLNYYYGLSPIQVAASVVQVGNERWTADAAILGNRGISGIIGDKSQLPMLPEEAEKVDDALRTRIGGAHKYGGIIVSNKDLTYTNIAMSSADLELLKKGIVTTRTLCNVLGLDSSLFNDPENKTYNNRLEAEKAMYTNCIIPLSGKISEAFTQYLCKPTFEGQKVRMRQDFSKVECLQENLKEKADILGSFKDKGIYTANEVRVKMGDEKSDDPNADLLIINTTPINNLQNSQQPK